MASDKQINANRLNAKKSTGPRTSQGKAVSRFNNLKHGVRAETLILPTENRQDFDHIHYSFDEEFDPQTPSESVLVEQLAISQWKLRRIEKAQNALLTLDSDGLQNSPALDRLYRLELRFQHSFLTTYKELDRIRKQRMKHADKEETEEESQEPTFYKGRIWGSKDNPIEASSPILKYPDGHTEPLYPGDPRRKQYGWDFEPDREHAYQWDPKNDPWRKPGDPLNQRPARPPKPPKDPLPSDPSS